MIESPKNFIEQFQNFIEHIAGVMKTFLTKEVADNYYLGKTAEAASATKATQDANGNVISDTYATKSELTSGLATKQPVGDYRTKSELDSIYLGINAKAKSAESADKATEAETAKSIEWSGITGAPAFWPKFNWGSVVKANVQYNRKTWTAPSDGFIIQICTQNSSGNGATGYLHVLIDNADFPSPQYDAEGGLHGWFPINKGSTITQKGNAPTFFSFIPIAS